MTVAELFVSMGVSLEKDSFERANKAISSLKKVAVGLGAAVGLTKLAGFVEHVSEAAVHTLGMAAALGMSTKTVQEWSYVAQQAGSDVNQFSVGISMFERNLREVAAGRGSKRFQQAMSDIGIDANDAKRYLSGPDGINEAIFKVSDTFKAMGNTANRAALTGGLFGAKARGMAHDLGVGSDELRTRIQHLRDIGGVVDNKDLVNLKNLNNRLNDVKLSLTAMASQVVASLAPGFIKMVESATAWIVANKDLIEGTFTAAIEGLGYAFSIVGDIIKFVGDTIHDALGGDDGAQALLIGLGVLVAALLMPTVLWAAATIAAIAPWLALAAIIGVIAYALIKLVKHWDAIKHAAGEAIEWIHDKFAALGDWIASLPGRAIDAIKGLGASIVQAFSDAWDAVVAGFHKAILKVGKMADDFASEHDWIISAIGLGPVAAAAHERYQAAQASANTTNTSTSSSSTSQVINVHAPIEIHGVRDAIESVTQVHDALERTIRDAAHAANASGV